MKKKKIVALKTLPQAFRALDEIDNSINFGFLPKGKDQGNIEAMERQEL